MSEKSSADSARVGDAARLLPIAGAFLLLPPTITLFVVDVDIGGVPLIVVYLFGVWLALIGCAAWLARRLTPRAERETEEAGTPHA